MFVITTPTGNVGSEVVRLLVERTSAIPYRVAAHTPAKIQQRYGASVPCSQFDFSDPASWPAVLEDISCLFLVCPQPDPNTIRTQILPFIDAVVQSGCQHIIYMSVPGADRFKILPHYQIERHLEASGVAYTILRPAYFMQNFIRKAPTHGVDIATRHEIFVPAGKGHITLVDARDVARVVVQIAENPAAHRNISYKLTTSASLDMYQVASVFSQVLEQPIHYPRPSLPRFWYRLRKRQVPWSLLLIMSIEYSMARLGHAVEVTDTLTTLLKEPPTSLAQFVEDNRQRWSSQSWV